LGDAVPDISGYRTIAIGYRVTLLVIKRGWLENSKKWRCS
jgi:hypothetical protein